jgi:hypothetical protein
MKCSNLKRPSSSGFPSQLLFIAALPVYLQILQLYLIMSFLHRLHSLLLRSNMKKAKEAPQVSRPSDSETHEYIDGLTHDYKSAWLNKCLYDPTPDCDQFPL